MSFLRALWLTEASAAVLLLSCALALAIFSAVVGGSSMLGAKGSAEITFWYTLILGAGPALLFGAPIYAFLRSRGYQRVWIAAALGAAPGVFALVVEPQLAPHAFGVGLVVAVGTHCVLAMVRE